jgi:hypothetical protein
MEQYLRAYCNYQQDNWQELLTLAEFCYNNSTSGTTRVSPFFATYGYHPRTMEDVVISGESQAPVARDYIMKLQELHQQLRDDIAYSQDVYAEQANRRRLPDPVLKPGEQVWLKRKNIQTTRPSEKLDWKMLGPYTISERVGSRAYKLDLPPSVHIHPVFHISLLEPTSSSTPIPGQINTPPPPIEVEGEPEWEVEKILDSRIFRNRLQYRVKWSGYHDLDKTWYNSENFTNAKELIQDFHNQYPSKPNVSN